MVEYIKKEDAIEAVDKEYATHDIAQAEENIRELPAADVRENVKGKWIFGSSMGHSWMKCSECCVSQSGQTACFSYCPNCGADMT